MNTAIDIDKKTLTLGFVGVGWIGRNRMEVLLNSGLADAAAIIEPYGENVKEALLLAPEATVYEDISEVYADAEIDGVVIATPSAMHAQQALAALHAGKAVFCQKPLGRTGKEVQAIVEASAKADRFLAVDLSYRYTKAFQKIYEVLSAGSLGKIYAVNLVFHNAYGPDKDWFYDIKQSGGGCVMDLGIHLIDLALCALGFPETEVISSNLFSKGEPLMPGEEKVEDFANVSLRTAGGTVIRLDCSWNISAGKDAVIEATFYGTEGGAAFKNVDGSFYNFVAEQYKGTSTQVIMSGSDPWSGRAGVIWAQTVSNNNKYDAITANEYLKTAQLIDRIYGR